MARKIRQRNFNKAMKIIRKIFEVGNQYNILMRNLYLLFRNILQLEKQYANVYTVFS